MYMNAKDTFISWAVLSASFILSFMETGIVKSLGVLLPDIREQFSTQTWVIGFAISMTPGFGAVVCLLSGAASKVFQPRAVVMLCALLGVFGLFIASSAKTVAMIVIAFIMTGFSTGTTPVVAAVLPLHFDKHITLAVVVFNCGMSLGIIVMPLLTQFLLGCYGWRGTTLLLGGLSLHSFVCGALIRSNTRGYKTLSQSKRQKRSPENHRTRRWCSASWLEEYLDVSIFSNLSFLLVLLITAGTGFCFTGWLIYVVPHAIDIGFTSYKASVIATAGGVANLAGNILYPLLANVLPNKAILYISVGLMSASFAMDPFASSFLSYIGLVLCALAFGLGAGLKINAEYVMTVDAIAEEQLNIGMGLGFAAYGISSVVSGFVCGWLYDSTGSYVISFLVLSGVSLVTLVPQCIIDTSNRSSRH